MNIGDSEDKNDVTHTTFVSDEEIKTVGKLELLGVILDSKFNFLLIISAQSVRRRARGWECLCDWEIQLFQ